MILPFMNLKAQYEAYRHEIDRNINEVLNQATYILGPDVKALEQDLASFVGSKFAISCNSGTDALLLALMGLGIGPGDEVITSAFSFFASAEIIALAGATPVFVDIDPLTYNVDTKQIAQKLTSKTKAIIPVSLFGQCAPLDAINRLAEPMAIAVIEDGAQSFGALSYGRRSCSMTKLGCTSFYPAKPLGAYGDGGAVFTSDASIAEKILRLRSHGQQETYKHLEVGLCSRLDTIQAAILRAKLPHFTKELEHRQIAAKKYDDALKDHYVTPYVEAGLTSTYAQYTIQVKDRDKLRLKLSELGIPTAVHYPKIIPSQPAMQRYHVSEDDYPIAQKVSSLVLSLPMCGFIRSQDQDKVIDALLAQKEHYSV